MRGDFAHVSADYTPRTSFLARPYSRVTISTSRDCSRNFHREPRAQCGDGDVLSDAANAQFLRLVRAETDRPGRVCLEILRFGPELAVRTSEQELVGNQSIESGHVRPELRYAQLGFEGGDLRIGAAVQHPFYSSGLI